MEQGVWFFSAMSNYRFFSSGTFVFFFHKKTDWHTLQKVSNHFTFFFFQIIESDWLMDSLSLAIKKSFISCHNERLLFIYESHWKKMITPQSNNYYANTATQTTTLLKNEETFQTFGTRINEHWGTSSLLTPFLEWKS